MSPLVVAAILLAAHGGLFLYARRRAGGALATQGVLVFLRTRLGVSLMQRVARPSRLWGWFGDAAVIGTFAIAAGLIGMLLLRTYAAVANPVGFPSANAGLGSVVGLPGINPLIPLGFGISALLLAIVVHEAGHGILVHAEGLRLRSTGVVLLGVPIGAFVEPDPADLARASTRSKLRILAAGPGANLLLALLAGLLLSGPVLESIDIANDGQGAGVTLVAGSSPAEAAGLREGDILVSIAEHRVNTTADLDAALRATSPRDTVSVRFLRGEREQNVAVTLTSAPTSRERAYLGVQVIDLRLLAGFHAILAEPTRDGPRGFELGTMTSPPGAWILYLTYPILVFGSGIDVLDPAYASFFTSSTTLSVTTVHALAGFLYWTVWLNLSLAAFNALPIGPLDGGQMLRTITQDRWTHRAGIRVRVEEIRPANAGHTAESEDPARQPELDKIQARATGVARLATNASIVMLLLPALAPIALRILRI